MKKFRIFKQVPRIIFGPNSLDRISELLNRKSNNDYYVFIIDDVFKEKLKLDLVLKK